MSTSRISRSSEDALRKVLSKLSHLDLTGRVISNSAIMKAHGGYCDIFIGSLSPVLPGHAWKVKVAIKRLRIHLHDDRVFTKFLAKEIHVWSRLDHPNVLPLIGYMLEGAYPSLISEWIENGTVTNFLRDNPGTDIGIIVLGIANGLDYLHSQNVIHSDLKADNVLIGRFGQPLICDFGISRMITSSQTFSVSTAYGGSIRGSTRWMSIELFGIDSDMDPIHTKASDIWAYGMTVYEIISKQRPYAHLKADQRVILAIIRGELPSRPDSVIGQLPALEDVWAICEDCWKTDPDERITIKQVISRLDKLNRPYLSSCQAQVEPSLQRGALTKTSLGMSGNRSSRAFCHYSGLVFDPAIPSHESETESAKEIVSSLDSAQQGKIRRGRENSIVGSPTKRLVPKPEPAEASDGTLHLDPMRARFESQENEASERHVSIRGGLNGEVDGQPLKNVKDPRINLPPLPASRKRPFPLSSTKFTKLNQTAFATSILAKSSQNLISYDLRLPQTCVRKPVRGVHWTHLNASDLMQAACHPPQRRILIFLHARPDCVIEVHMRPMHAWRQSFVTVEDVLDAVNKRLTRAINPERWLRDILNVEAADNLNFAFLARVEKLERMKLTRLEEAQKKGMLEVDCLGLQWRFLGLSFAFEYNSELWWSMDVGTPG
ncbi:hypothetical protein M0805_004706 [Coniferiporia weirii]|nr:hypothetical protein M0805_004706 [Coniferiporia weirii]